MWIILLIIGFIVLYTLICIISLNNNTSNTDYSDISDNDIYKTTIYEENTQVDINIKDKTNTKPSSENIPPLKSTKINGELSENEIIFLKFMNNKSTDIEFSPRWEFQYDIKPRITLSKLLNLKYLTYSKYKDNVKNSTISELKQFLKNQNYKISGNKEELIKRVLLNFDEETLKRNFHKRKYILSNKGQQALNKNKDLFMSNREKAGDDFKELTNYEYDYLIELGQTNEYIRLKNNDLSFSKGYSKNDILWAIYNVQKDVMISKRKFEEASIIYDRMFSLLFDENKYKDALIFLLCSSYLEGYNTIIENEETEPEDMKQWFYINISIMQRKVSIIEKETHIIKNNGIDWLVSNSIDKYLKKISKEPIRSSYIAKLKEIFYEYLND